MSHVGQAVAFTSDEAVKRLGRVMVTGANGFVGSNVAARLAMMGGDVVAGVRTGRRIPSDMFDDSFEITHLELNFESVSDLRKRLEGIDAIVHCAGQTAARSYRDYLLANRRATRNLLQASASQDKPPRTVLISSISASGPRQPNRASRPEDAAKPVSLYGRSKLAGEEMARRFATRVPISILRPGIVFGPGDREVFAMFKLIAQTHFNFVPGYHRPRFPFIAVQDLIHALVQTLVQGRRIIGLSDPNLPDLDRGTGIYFVADPVCYTFGQFGKVISRALGHRWVGTIPVGTPILHVAALLQDKLAALGMPDTLVVDKIREAAAPSWECDVSKTKDELGWSPSASIEERVCETLDWYRNHHWL